VTLFCLWIFPQHHLLSNLSFPPLSGLRTIVENHLAIYMWVYFQELYSVPLVYWSVFMPVPCCVDYCGFKVSFEIWKTETSNFFSFKIVLIIWSILRFYMNKMDFSISVKGNIGILIGIILIMYIALGNIGIITRLSLLTHGYGISFHLFVFSLIYFSNHCSF
jgi:hypothetical protein